MKTESVFNYQPTHLIFEGAELSGKSFLMSRIYPSLEKEGTGPENFLNGCFWINSDIGIFGGEYGEPIIRKYIEMAEILTKKSVIFEKLHISDMVYKIQVGQPVPDYSEVEKKLAEMHYRIVFTVFDQSEPLLEKRLRERLDLYPHYQKIAGKIGYYLKQQEIFREVMKKSILPYFEINLRNFSEKEIQPLREWIGKTNIQ